MIRFARLFESLDQTTKTNEKVAAMADYFAAAPPQDTAWAVYYLSGRRAKRLVKTGLVKTWATDAAGIPEWLFNESYDAVGDLAETVTLIVPDGQGTTDRPLADWIEQIHAIGRLDEPQQRAAVEAIWAGTAGTVRFVAMKLITGSFRIGVSARLVARGVAQASGLPADVIAHRLMGHWKPDAKFAAALLSPDTGDAALSQPYPFCLAHAVPTGEGTEKGVENIQNDHDHEISDPEAAGIGSPGQFRAEWKWDGIRGQVIRRDGRTFVWSRGEDLMSGRWPEVESAAEFLPDGTVIDGEILASRIGPAGDVEVLPFADLQRRIGRKTIGKKLLAEVPVMFHAFDLIEHRGEDLRERPLSERLSMLDQMIGLLHPPGLVLSPPLAFASWDDLATIRRGSREKNAEGLMLKRLDSPYTVGRTRGVWWKWKVAPYTVDAVMVYAQRGHGKRASLYTDYTFAVWDEAGELVPFAKAYSGLTDAEINQVDRFVRQNTSQRFGPVRTVKPELVFELAFEGLQKSTRHKSGLATRFPRILRWRRDKKPQDADKLADLRAMLQ